MDVGVREAPPAAQALLAVGAGLPGQLGPGVAEVAGNLAARLEPAPPPVDAAAGHRGLGERVVGQDVQVGIVEGVALVVLTGEQFDRHTQGVGVTRGGGQQMEQAEAQIALGKVVALDANIAHRPQVVPDAPLGLQGGVEAGGGCGIRFAHGIGRDADGRVARAGQADGPIEHDGLASLARELVLHYRGEMPHDRPDRHRTPRGQGVGYRQLHVDAPGRRAGLQAAAPIGGGLNGSDRELPLAGGVRVHLAGDPADQANGGIVVHRRDAVPHHRPVRVAHAGEARGFDSGGPTGGIAEIEAVGVQPAGQVELLTKADDLAAGQAQLAIGNEDPHHERAGQVGHRGAAPGGVEIAGVQIAAFLVRGPDLAEHVQFVVHPVDQGHGAVAVAILGQAALEPHVAVRNRADAVELTQRVRIVCRIDDSPGVRSRVAHQTLQGTSPSVFPSREYGTQVVGRRRTKDGSHPLTRLTGVATVQV